MTNSVPTDETLVALAYAMAIGPERLYELQEGLSARLREAGGDGSTSGEELIAGEFGSLEAHFANALEMLHQGSRQRRPAWNAIQLMEQDHRALAMVGQGAEVRYANDAARRALGLATDGPIDIDLLEEGSEAAFRAALSRLGSVEDNRILGIFKMMDAQGGPPRQMGLKQVRDDNGVATGYLFEMSAIWDVVLATKFKDLMKLTGAELEILRAIVTGMTLSDLAEERGRKVSTVRLQAKRLLAKLHLRSQTELACLYAAFAENEARGTRSPAWDDADNHPRRRFESSAGRVLTYEVAGPPAGRSIVFFPALLGGTTLTPGMYRQLFARGLRLIMVWRPGMAGCSPPSDPTMSAFRDYAADMAELLDMLGIERCPVIGHITSIMFAYGLACHQPDRVESVIGVNPTTPCHRGAHVSAISVDEKLRFMLMRRAPKVGRMLVHAMLAKVEAGFDEEFLTRFLDNKIDHETMQDPHLRDGFRKSFSKTIEQGYDSFSHELALCGLDWQPVVDGTRCPVVLCVGESNPVYSPDLLRTFAHAQHDTKVLGLSGAAHLLFYQRMDAVLDAIPHADALTDRLAG
ncbi:LuxR C-terminal-related transcriptional regulator [Pontivivens insulae]|uniref:Aminoacrylate hydrolase RutD n=1 Tax=Pontivivens insulae TaxID=1639689 RepID=A0A2R8A702_9RHOB|nr:LuxR C-terminal-related transcriptional regulator [Pontivivens insulae]RED18079.1 pimeloyl-ACP methyl ester carboxylesterase [Pontivivens insulae]SPF27976.1 Putative aminoacrylate hydrolase RutD [Pontivivens insulae]